MSKYTYRVEVHHAHYGWVKLLEDPSRLCAAGYFMGRTDARMPPSPAMRLIRSDGKVIDDIPEDAEVSVGMVAGFPTPEQYEAAAERAVATAKRLREMESARLARRAKRENDK